MYFSGEFKNTPGTSNKLEEFHTFQLRWRNRAALGTLLAWPHGMFTLADLGSDAAFLSTNKTNMTEPEGERLKVAVYARVSTEEQREGQTINSQVAELEHFARSKRWAICGIYKD